MKPTFKAIILAGFLTAQTISVHAAEPSPADQVNAAIAKGDLKTAQLLVSQNPNLGGPVEIKLLQLANKNLAKDPQSSQIQMTLASNLSPYINEPSGPTIIADIRKLVESINNANKPEEQKKVMKAETAISILNSALTIAQSKVIATLDPELAPWIEDQLTIYADENDVLLAQSQSVGSGFGNSFSRLGPALFTPPTSDGGSAF